MTKKETLQMLTYVAALYPSLTVDELVVAAWDDVMGDMPNEFAAQAMREIAREPRQFAPSAGEVYSRAKELKKAEASRRRLLYREARKLLSKNVLNHQIVEVIRSGVTDLGEIVAKFEQKPGKVAKRIESNSST